MSLLQEVVRALLANAPCAQPNLYIKLQSPSNSSVPCVPNLMRPRLQSNATPMRTLPSEPTNPYLKIPDRQLSDSR